MTYKKINNAFIMAAGRGTRLMPLTKKKSGAAPLAATNSTPCIQVKTAKEKKNRGLA